MLTLSPTQWQEMAKHEAANFCDTVTNQFLADRPDMASSPGRQVISDRMRSAYTYAWELGYSSTPHVTKLMYLAADAPEFFREPNVDKQLRKPGYPPEQRLDDYLAAVNYRLKGMKTWQP